MYQTSSKLKIIFTYCILFVLAILTTDCTTNPTSTPTPLPPPLPLPTPTSRKLEPAVIALIQMLTQNYISSASWDIVAYIENGKVVQVWKYDDGKLINIPIEEKAIGEQAMQETMSANIISQWRANCQAGIESKGGTQSQINIYEPNRITVQKCWWSAVSLSCDDWKLEQVESQWKISSNTPNRGNCDTRLFSPRPTPTP